MIINTNTRKILSTMSDEFESIFHRVAQELETREMGMTSTNTHTVSIEHGENQLGKRQDFATAGKGLDHETGEPLEWAALFDGHGSNTICWSRGRIPVEAVVPKVI